MLLKLEKIKYQVLSNPHAYSFLQAVRCAGKSNSLDDHTENENSKTSAQSI